VSASCPYIGELALALVEVSELPERPERSPSAAERSESTAALKPRCCTAV
jgi:hypothetical protein